MVRNGKIKVPKVGRTKGTRIGALFEIEAATGIGRSLALRLATTGAIPAWVHNGVLRLAWEPILDLTNPSAEPAARVAACLGIPTELVESAVAWSEEEPPPFNGEWVGLKTAGHEVLAHARAYGIRRHAYSSRTLVGWCASGAIPGARMIREYRPPLQPGHPPITVHPWHVQMDALTWALERGRIPPPDGRAGICKSAVAIGGRLGVAPDAMAALMVASGLGRRP